MNADGRTRLNQTPEWTALAKHREELAGTHLRDLFAADPARGAGYTLQIGDLHVDYSKHLVTDETLRPQIGIHGAFDGFGGQHRIALDPVLPDIEPALLAR